jgi:hypothetical protein
MNTSQNKNPIAEFREVKFEPAVLVLKTGLKPTARQHERHRKGVENSAGWFGRSEFVRTACPILPARPPRLPKNSAKCLLRESEMEPKR